MPTVMTTGQLATKLAVHENTLGRWRDEGMPHHAAGGKYIYEWREVSEWLESTDRGGYLILAGGVSEAEVFGDGS